MSKFKPGDTFICEHCKQGSLVKTYTDSVKFCSRQCAAKAKHAATMVTFDCEFCRETVTLQRKSDRAAYDNFCSVQCRADAKKVAKLRVNHCEICNTAFVVKKERWGKRFCSMKCVAINKSNNTSTTTKDCKQCGTHFTVQTSTITATSPRDYCSRKCSIDSRRNPNHPVLENGKHLRSDGYIGLCVDGVMTVEHRVIMENHLNRKLLPNENVHHLNGVKTDNRLENLELWETAQPYGQRVSDKIAEAQRVLEQYKDFIPPD